MSVMVAFLIRWMVTTIAVFVAVQLPLFQPKAEAFGALGSTPFGSPSNWNVMATVAVDI